MALTLRLFRLGDWSFWHDEYFTLSGLEDGFNYSLIRRSLASDLIRFTVRLLGQSEWAARLVPALIGALTVLVLYFLLRPLAAKWVPLLAALLLAVSPWHLYWSQSARFYVLLLLFSSVSLIFFYRGLEEDRPAFLILALLFLVLATRERLLALLLVPVLALYPLLLWLFRFDRPAGLRWSRLLLFFSPLVLGATLFLLPYALNFSQWMRNFGPPDSSPQQILAGLLFDLTVPLTCLATFGAIRLILLKNRQGLFFALVAFVPILLMMGISLFHVAGTRYVLVSLLGWIVLAALTVQDLYDHTAGGAKILAVGVLTLLVASCLVDTGLYFFYRNGNRPDYRGALQYIRENTQPGDQVVVDQRWAEYYLGQPGVYYSAFDWQERLATRTWFVEEEHTRADHPEQLAWIREHCRLMGIFDVARAAGTYPLRVFLFTPALGSGAP